MSDTEFSFQIPLAKGISGNKNRTRRSSIFRTRDITESPTAHYDTNYQFSPDYAAKLVQENVKWKEVYTAMKTECLELKKRSKNGSGVFLSTDMAIYDQYLKKADDFCNQINNVAEIHDNIINYRNLRRKELLHLMQTTKEQIHRKLNKKE